MTSKTRTRGGVARSAIGGAVGVVALLILLSACGSTTTQGFDFGPTRAPTAAAAHL